MRCFSTATFFSTAILKFYCRFYCHFFCHFLVAVEPKNLSTASGSRDQKTVLQPLAVEVKNSSTASGSRIQKSFYCHFYCHIYRDYDVVGGIFLNATKETTKLQIALFLPIRLEKAHQSQSFGAIFLVRHEKHTKNSQTIRLRYVTSCDLCSPLCPLLLTDLYL